MITFEQLLLHVSIYFSCSWSGRTGPLDSLLLHCFLEDPDFVLAIGQFEGAVIPSGVIRLVDEFDAVPLQALQKFLELFPPRIFIGKTTVCPEWKDERRSWTEICSQGIYRPNSLSFLSKSINVTVWKPLPNISLIGLYSTWHMLWTPSFPPETHPSHSAVVGWPDALRGCRRILWTETRMRGRLQGPHGTWRVPSSPLWPLKQTPATNARLENKGLTAHK